MPRDPYEVLGVSKSATAEEIQKAYRKLSKKYHPDRNPGDKQADAKYKEVQDAYEILGDPTKKANYDQFGFAGAAGRVPRRGRLPGRGFPVAVEVPRRRGGMPSTPRWREELFSGSAAGWAGGRLRPGRPVRRGATEQGPRRVAAAAAEPVEAEVTVPFEVAANGGSRRHRVGGRADRREGARRDRGGQETPRPGRRATGSARRHPEGEGRSRTRTSAARATTSSSTCRSASPRRCSARRWRCRRSTGERLAVKVPPGTSSGAKLRLRGKGVDGGDQYLVFKVDGAAGRGGRQEPRS